MGAGIPMGVTLVITWESMGPNPAWLTSPQFAHMPTKTAAAYFAVRSKRNGIAHTMANGQWPLAVRKPAPQSNREVDWDPIVDLHKKRGQLTVVNCRRLVHLRVRLMLFLH
eukprot:TRINITY_DN65170_c0_g1_i1.p4 TRINITY_DN65170_c0_g1~~TRINITY_DN65170_c0_g1_i1.p4  ORF type:complete len:111 (-),score=0.43 TRINITY_DN65170_c0_g1_i1:1130-1462(-)